MHNDFYHECFEDDCEEEQLPDVLTAAEVMDILKIGKNTMYRLLNTGAIKGFRMGRSWRISLDSLMEFRQYRTKWRQAGQRYGKMRT